MFPQEYAIHIVETIGKDNLRYHSRGLWLRDGDEWQRIYYSDMKEFLESREEIVGRSFVHDTIKCIRWLLPKETREIFELWPLTDKYGDLPSKEYTIRHVHNRKIFLAEVARQARRRADPEMIIDFEIHKRAIAYVNMSGACAIETAGKIYVERPAEKHLYSIILTPYRSGRAVLLCIGEELEALAGWCADVLFAAGKDDPLPPSPVSLEAPLSWGFQTLTCAAQKVLDARTDLK